jgi:hypothetical protein
MQQYLINTTAIWLLSLLFYDIFLRRENYHAYNRFYLLSTLLLGALLPLVQWGPAGYVFPGAIGNQVERIVSAKQALAVAPDTAMSQQKWVALIYGIGVVVAICLLLSDVAKLLRFSAMGKKSFHDGWKIIETGKDHAPFSLRHVLFVCGRQQYNADEWSMILAHEQRHTSLWHFADLLLLHIARIVFWFHPLVYVYNKRLLLVHEYQADNAAATEPQQYGKFLVEQAVLHASPSIVQSFNRSPIKNRIIMLTRNSTAASRAKMLVLLPLLAIAVSCFSKNANPGSGSAPFKKDGNTVTYKGNKFILSDEQRDTITVLDPVTGEEITQVRILEMMPVSMNGRKIYRDYDISTEPQQLAHSVSLEEHVVANLSGDIDALPDGDYRFNISNIVIDEIGKVAYYEFHGITGTNNGVDVVLPKDIVSAMAARIEMAMGIAPVMKPGTMNDKAVLAMINSPFWGYKIVVRNHVTSYSRRK